MISALITQLKFVATYLVPSLYPSLLFAFSAVLAVFTAPFPGSEWPFVLNAIAWLGVLTIAATFALTLKKLFGRRPPLDEILSGLVTVASLKEFREEQGRRDAGLETQIAAVHDETETAFNAAFTREGDRERDIREMRDILSRLQERTETHIRKLDQYDGRFDLLLRRFGSFGEQT
jgi:hypothetical protein